jgi:hypothetical protein
MVFFGPYLERQYKNVHDLLRPNARTRFAWHKIDQEFIQTRKQHLHFIDLYRETVKVLKYLSQF